MKYNILKKHYIKNFKNFLISQYIIFLKNIFFKNIININISFSKKTFFLSTFLLYTFYNNNINFTIKNKKYNFFLSIFSFFFLFNTLIYANLENLNIFKKSSKNLISIKFDLKNFFLIPISFFFFKKLRGIKPINISLKINIILKKLLYKYIQFFFNFFQIPLFKKILSK
jgi:hypothetical protein